MGSSAFLAHRALARGRRRHPRWLALAHDTGPFAIRRDLHMQRTVNVKVNLAAFVPEVAGSAVLALMQVRQGRQSWVLGMGPACCGIRVHGRPSIEMGWWFHPGETKVSRLLGAAPYVQRIFEICRVHLLAQRRLLARRGKAFELPGLVGTVLD